MAEKKTIYLAGGCFWGVEHLFRQVPGVVATQVGYANGTLVRGVTYERVCQGDTGYRETVRVNYDPAAISLETLLEAFLRIIDPTTANRQGNDRGTQYQTGIYWQGEDEESEAVCRHFANRARAELAAQALPFRVELGPLTRFVVAEEYHQEYLVKNPGGYCHVSPVTMAAVLAELS